MGFGGSTVGNVNVDIVQTDVQAIVDGICGWNGNTLSDVNNHLGSIDNNLYDWYNYRSITDVLRNMETILYDIRNNTYPP